MCLLAESLFKNPKSASYEQVPRLRSSPVSPIYFSHHVQKYINHSLFSDVSAAVYFYYCVRFRNLFHMAAPFQSPSVILNITITFIIRRILYITDVFLDSNL